MNSTVVSPRPLSKIAEEIDDLRAGAGKRRKRKSDAAIVIIGLVGFGTEAQKMFSELPVPVQDAALLELVKAVALRLQTLVESVVVHRDESAIHAHFELRGYTHSGQPVTAIATRSTLSDLQDITHSVLYRYCPGIERGNKKSDRLEAGASLPDIINKSVRELHRELPQALNKKRSELAAAEEKLAACQEKEESLAREAADRKAAAQAQEVADNERIRQQDADLAAREQALIERDASVRERLAVEKAAIKQAEQEADNRQAEALELEQRLHTSIDALMAISHEVKEGTFRLDGDRWRMRDSKLVKRAPKDVMFAIMPSIIAIATRQAELSEKLAHMNELHDEIATWLSHMNLPENVHREGQCLSERLQRI